MAAGGGPFVRRILEGGTTAFLRYVAGARLFNAVALAVVLSATLWTPGSVAGEPPVRILALGDSLVAGFGLPTRQGFVPQLQAELKKLGVEARVVQGGVSGDTSAGGLARLSWMLATKPAIAIVELGANDGLRGLPPDKTRANIDAILRRLKAAGVEVLLTGMLAPPNLGREYGAEFNAIYPDLAKSYGVMFYPFFLEGVAARPQLNQSDGIHPNAKGAAIIARRIAPLVKRLIDRRHSSRPGN